MEAESAKFCTICLTSIFDNNEKTRALLKPCNHTYCYSCIEEWLRLNFSCPNCLFKVEHVFRCFENKMEEVIGFNVENKKIEKKEESYDCLDHNFFKEEIRVLNERTQIIWQRMKGKKNDFDLEYLDSIKEVLLDKASIMDQLVHFNPQDLLNDIYYYDSVLRKIELNNWKDVNLDEFDFFFQEDNYQNEINYEENYFDDNFSNFICQSLTEKIIFSSKEGKSKKKKRTKNQNKDIICNDG